MIGNFDKKHENIIFEQPAQQVRGHSFQIESELKKVHNLLFSTSPIKFFSINCMHVIIRTVLNCPGFKNYVWNVNLIIDFPNTKYAIFDKESIYFSFE